MKKIVILGGGSNQIPLITNAKELGYYVILCDFRRDVKGIALSDIHYQVNTLNYHEVLGVCLKERPNGIITNSEPAMPIVARISQELGLIGNPEDSINKLLSKTRFRKLQEQIGIYCPKSFTISSLDEIDKNGININYPIIIKPCECSGSRGSKIIDEYDFNLVKEVFDNCKSYSRNGEVVIEEFVEMQSLTTIEGDIFIYNGEILWDGLFYTTRSSWAPMVPMTYTAPLFISNLKYEKIQSTLTKIFEKAGIVYGEYNIEGYFNKNEEFFVIEINPRQGGHEIPLFIKDYTGINFYKLLVSLAVGDNAYWDYLKTYYRHYSYAIKQTVFSPIEGKYAGLYIDDSIKSNVSRVLEYKNMGDKIEKCVDGTSLIAIVDLLFDSSEIQRKVYNKMNELIYVKLSK